MQIYFLHPFYILNMINKIDNERRRSMNAAPTRPSNKRQRQGAQEDPKEKTGQGIRQSTGRQTTK
jgi:hypothetical protein